MKYKGYLFDFDCTLADSTEGIYRCFVHTLAEAGCPPVSRQAILNTIGLTMDASFLALVPPAFPSPLSELKTIYRAKADEIMTKYTFLFPQSAETLQKLKAAGIKTGIVSTKNRYRIMETLLREKLTPYVDVIIGGEDVTSHKPSPEGLLLAAKRLQLAVDELLYIGDHIVDAKAAHSANVDFAAVLTGTTSAADFIPYAPTAVFSKLPECLHLLAKEHVAACACK